MVNTKNEFLGTFNVRKQHLELAKLF